MVSGQRAPGHRRHVVEQSRVDPQTERRGHGRHRGRPHRLEREQGAVRLDHGGRATGGVAQRRRERPGAGRGRHRQQEQVGSQGGADVDAEREGEVGVEVALVALVEHQGVGSRELGIAL